MDKETANKFFQTVHSWNKFFEDLHTLLDKISAIIEKEYGYHEKYYYYYKPDGHPRIPWRYYASLAGEAKLEIQLVIILDNDAVENRKIQIKEPSLFVICHNYKKQPGDGDIANDIFNGWNAKKINLGEDTISGILDWEPDVVFDAFRVPLDSFSEYKDEVVHELIISRLNKILKKK